MPDPESAHRPLRSDSGGFEEQEKGRCPGSWGFGKRVGCSGCRCLEARSWKSAVCSHHATSSSHEAPWACGGGRPSLNELHVVGREHAKVAVGPVAAPPAFINHLDARDEVLRVKGDLGIVSCKGGELRCRTGGPGALVAQHQPSLPRRCSSGLSPSTPSRRVRLWACAPAKGWRQYFPPCVSLCPEATPQSSLCAPTCRLYN